MNVNEFNRLAEKYIESQEESEYGLAFDFTITGLSATSFNALIKKRSYAVKVVHKEKICKTVIKVNIFEIIFLNRKSKAFWKGVHNEFILEELRRYPDAKDTTLYSLAIAKNPDELKKHEAAR